MKKILVLLCVFIGAVCAYAEKLPPLPSNSKPRPDLFRQAYGPDKRNTLDLWRASSDKPTPWMIFFHGGGFLGGDEWLLDPDLLAQCLKAGISVASANYRFSSQAPFPAPMLDGARAIQYLRYRAGELNLDPKRVCVTGDSAGAGISLWVGFHEDLSDPNSKDPVLHESTRPTCIGVIGVQCSYDLRFIRKTIGGRAYEHPALPQLFGLKSDEVDSPRAFALYQQASPIDFVRAGAPPVWMYYAESTQPLKPGPNQGPTLYYPQFGKEIEGCDHPGTGIHHPLFGQALKAKLDSLHVECVLRLQDDFPHMDKPIKVANKDLVEFMLRHF